MTIEEEAKELIQTLEWLIDSLRMVENGKNYTQKEARRVVLGVKYTLRAETIDL